jgi:hypothetical protein
MYEDDFLEQCIFTSVTSQLLAFIHLATLLALSSVEYQHATLEKTSGASAKTSSAPGAS